MLHKSITFTAPVVGITWVGWLVTILLLLMQFMLLQWHMFAEVFVCVCAVQCVRCRHPHIRPSAQSEQPAESDFQSVSSVSRLTFIA